MLIEPCIKGFIKGLKGKKEKERGRDFLLNMIDEDFKELNKLFKNKEITPELLLEKFKIFNTNLK